MEPASKNVVPLNEQRIIPPPSKYAGAGADISPLLDPATFDQLARVSKVMALSPIVPESLRGKNLDEGMASCLLVASQAMRWGFDPLAVAQQAFVTHGRLGYQGQLVAAVLDAKLGIKLEFEFSGSGMDRKIKATDPNNRKRVVEGTVKDWHTKDKNGNINRAWASQPDDQLIYRAQRQFARRYEPATIMGVYTADELEHSMRAEQARDITPPKEQNPPPSKAEAAPPNSAPPKSTEGAPPEAAKPDQKEEQKQDELPPGSPDPDAPASSFNLEEFIDNISQGLAKCETPESIAKIVGANKEFIEKNLKETDKERLRLFIKAAQTRVKKSAK